MKTQFFLFSVMAALLIIGCDDTPYQSPQAKYVNDMQISLVHGQPSTPVNWLDWWEYQQLPDGKYRFKYGTFGFQIQLIDDLGDLDNVVVCYEYSLLYDVYNQWFTKIISDQQEYWGKIRTLPDGSMPNFVYSAPTNGYMLTDAEGKCELQFQFGTSYSYIGWPPNVDVSIEVKITVNRGRGREPLTGYTWLRFYKDNEYNVGNIFYNSLQGLDHSPYGGMMAMSEGGDVNDPNIGSNPYENYEPNFIYDDNEPDYLISEDGNCLQVEESEASFMQISTETTSMSSLSSPNEPNLIEWRRYEPYSNEYTDCNFIRPYSYYDNFNTYALSNFVRKVRSLGFYVTLDPNDVPDDQQFPDYWYSLEVRSINSDGDVVDIGYAWLYRVDPNDNYHWFTSSRFIPWGNDDYYYYFGTNLYENGQQISLKFIYMEDDGYLEPHLTYFAQYGDYNYDGITNNFDFATLSDVIKNGLYKNEYDYNLDGQLDTFDMIPITDNWITGH